MSSRQGSIVEENSNQGLSGATTDNAGPKINNTDLGHIDSTGNTEVRAKFVEKLSDFNDSKPQTSPLLSSTPPTVAKALVRSYPYLLIMNKILSILTWTNDDYWVNIVILSTYSLAILYFENIITWFGHLLIVGIITLYSYLNTKIIEETDLHPTLDDVVQALTATCNKADVLLTPITSLSLNADDIKRLLFTTVFLTPIYLTVTFFVITPRLVLLMAGIYLLTYHSTFSCTTRKILWKVKVFRLICYYLTGLDFSRAKNHSLFAAAFAKVQKSSANSLNLAASSKKNVRFTYVIYENQRRWLGIGWTSNLLSYERTPWTDEFLNESSSIESFQLPNTEDTDYSFGNHLYLSNSGAKWEWVDKTWRLDLTNDGAISLPSNKRSKTTADPGPDEGFIYTDNMWKKPSTEDSFSKYTRRRRWIRTAELVFTDDSMVFSNADTLQSTATGVDLARSSAGLVGRKSIRFSDTKELKEDDISSAQSEHKKKEKDTLDETSLKASLSPPKVSEFSALNPNQNISS